MKNPAMIKNCFVSILVQLRYSTGLLKMLLVISLLNGPMLFAQVGVHTDFPDASAAMDIYATNKGLLIPRVTLTEDLGNPGPISSPAIGLLVFNNGANQPMGFYYWDGALWISTSGVAGNDYWLLKGNSGTEVGTNFLGTIDSVDLAVYTNSLERMRIEADGQVVIGDTAPNNAGDLFTVIGNSTQNYAINAYSPYIGVFSDADRTGFQSSGGRYGLVALMDSATGFAVYGKNTDPLGWGMVTAGGNTPANVLANHTAGLSSTGTDGFYTDAIGTSGTGIIALGNNLPTAAFLASGSGGAFYGYHGTFSKASNSSGIGVIGVGNNTSTYSAPAVGCGGTFTGYHGVYANAIDAASGTGIIAVGNNLATYYTLATGSGGAFTGYHGTISTATNVAAGTGVIGVGNNGGYTTLSTGGGGAFIGANNGAAGWATSSTGTGIIGAGNNIAPAILATGSGGAFIGTESGSAGWATSSTGTGVVGAGNNVAATFYTGIGSGGAFTGNVCGVYGYATGAGNGTYGGYFSNGGATSYAYVGYRVSNQNRKIVGNGTVSTIVKNTRGELIALTCPEAPETVFQDFGIGQLVDGKAHITIDPDLAININVSDNHPLKVYITPEGDCNGVYVTNKSTYGFDVIELQGGHSNVSFSWQIVAIRANEEYKLKDGTTEISDYSQRFPPAPGPLEMKEVKIEKTILNKQEQVSVQNQPRNEQPVIVEKTPVEEIMPNGQPGK